MVPVRIPFKQSTHACKRENKVYLQGAKNRKRVYRTVCMCWCRGEERIIVSLPPSCDMLACITQVEAEMELLKKQEEREIEVYKRELMAWFKQQKEEQDRSRVLEEHTAKERFKVSTNSCMSRDTLLCR